MPAGPATARRTADDVVDAALEILDTHGLPGLSMRRIADFLDLQPSALYWHFPNKQSLLAAVSERVLAPLRDSNASDFQRVAQQFRDALLDHRDGAELVYSSYALGLSDMPALDLFETAAAGAEQAGTAARTAVHYVLGFVLFEQQQEFAARLGVIEQPAADRDAEFDAGIALLEAGLRPPG
ncbi:TetR family transcriptional regulator [Branchiibius sp. NY16-3462-2]|uniref:TetR family transcriptional regulator n=1 Tax=Branchiibius sp. NY16-3462-2 TaxID=1807500 RepID=UPI000793AB68|nr:TetR family transcriptional regulator [Branchiibius sp. NY16-3462-2]KYH44886.1 hypothetical protein AZH51_01795 [Branchiibius sp. NY16-3462-2]